MHSYKLISVLCVRATYSDMVEDKEGDVGKVA